MFSLRSRISLGTNKNIFKLDKPAGLISTVIVNRHPNSLAFKMQMRHKSGMNDVIITKELGVKLAHQKYQVPFQPDDTVPIIILHGLLGSKTNWHSIARALHEATYNRKVITLDARNHGDSPQIPEFSYEHMVCDLVKFLNDQNITKASFVGHSMGGRVSMLFALLYPKMVHSMVVVDISPINQSPKMIALKDILKALVDLDIDPDVPLRVARKQAAVQLEATVKDPQLVNFLLTNLVEKKHSTQWRWKINSKVIYKNFLPHICNFPLPNKNFTGRTLFVAGQNSDYILPQHEDQIKDIFLDAEFTYIKGAGHWVHADKPKEFLNVVSHFFNCDGPVTY